MARRSTASKGSSVGAPCTWHRKPSSAYLSARTTPDFASRKLASTSWVLFPIDETMPIPVTTTRRIPASSASLAPTPRVGATSRLIRRHLLVEPEQPDLEVHGPVDDRSVGLEPAVGDAQHELGAHHALDVDAIDDLFDIGQDLARQLDLAGTERTAVSGRAAPSQKEPKHLPERIEAEAARHDRIALEMAGEKPQVRLEVEHCTHQALAVLATRLRDL